MSHIFCLLLLLAPHGVILTNQDEELHVTFTSSEYPIVKVNVQAGCDDDKQSNETMKVKISSCPGNTKKKPIIVSDRLSGVCKNGATLCLSPRFRNEECAVIRGVMNNSEYRSSELSLANITIYNRGEQNKVAVASWMQQGNTSVLLLKKVPGVPVYKLYLTVRSKNIQGVNCTNRVLNGVNEQSRLAITFKAHWHQEVNPGCSYRTWFWPENGCGKRFISKQSVQLPTLEYKHQREAGVTLEPRTTRIFMAAMGTEALFLVVVLLLVFVSLHQTKKYRLIPSLPTISLTTVKKSEMPASPRPTVLLVYTASLQPQMAALANSLKELTQLQIEDLHDVGDQDKLNDPTVWLTRRLLNANTRFVLACSHVRPDNKETNEESQEGGVVQFLLDHFLQYLHSSSLAYDYTRLHLVRLEDQAHVDVRDVTPGRVYQLNAHLPLLARNLTLAEPTTSISPSDAPSTEC